MVCASSDQFRLPLHDETEILRSTIYHLSEGVVVADKEGLFLICNQKARSVLGISMQSDAPQAWSEVRGFFKPDAVTPYPPDELPSARAIAGETVSEMDIFIRNDQCPAGIWVAIQASPLRKEGGAIRGSVVVFRNITNKKERDTRIQILTSAVEQTADSIIITDRGGVIEYVNPAFESTTGYTREELTGLTPRILNSGVHDHVFYENLWATILAGTVFRDTMANRKKNGEIFYAEQTITPMWGPTGAITHFVTVIKDVTEQKKLQEQQFQMSLARAVQQQFYEIPRPQIEGFDFAAAAFPADAIGGDYFDFISFPDDCIGIIIGDVCGHGIGSALLMAEIRAYLRAFALGSRDAAEILTLMNNALASDLKQDHYATLIFCRLDPNARTLVYASAGHTPGFILDANGSVKRTLDSIDIPLGFLPGHLFGCSKPIPLQPGDILALLTDGITDAERPDQNYFGLERSLDYIRDHREESAQNIVTGLYRAIREFSDGLPQTDDITAVICKIPGIK
jgi:sigma-B regulation protein RsbU (phosphoserine phosphatase)